MNPTTYIMLVVLLITVIFVIYFLMLGSRISNLEKKLEDLHEDSQQTEYRIAHQIDGVLGVLNFLNKEVMDLKKGQVNE